MAHSGGGPAGDVPEGERDARETRARRVGPFAGGPERAVGGIGDHGGYWGRIRAEGGGGSLGASWETGGRGGSCAARGEIPDSSVLGPCFPDRWEARTIPEGVAEGVAVAAVVAPTKIQYLRICRNIRGREVFWVREVLGWP